MVNDPDVSPSLCYPGKAEVAELVAEITGKRVGSVEDMVAVVRCSRVEGEVQRKEHYLGYNTCAAASLAFGGPFSCHYACVGQGDCAESCPFDAITMMDGFPVVDPDRCVSCGACVRVCPKNIIELMPLKARIWVPCSTQDPGKTVKQLCRVGCIACRMCVKACPADAVTLEDNIVRIDHQKCMAYGPECGEVCVEKCPRDIFRHFTRTKKAEEKPRAEAA